MLSFSFVSVGEELPVISTALTAEDKKIQASFDLQRAHHLRRQWRPPATPSEEEMSLSEASLLVSKLFPHPTKIYGNFNKEPSTEELKIYKRCATLGSLISDVCLIVCIHHAGNL